MKQKNLKAKVEEIETTKIVETKDNVIKLKATRTDYVITVLLLLLIGAALGFIIWTRNGYADNFTEQFQETSIVVIDCI